MIYIQAWTYMPWVWCIHLVGQGKIEHRHRHTALSNTVQLMSSSDISIGRQTQLWTVVKTGMLMAWIDTSITR